MLKLQDIRDYCALKRGVTETFPFDFQTLAIRVGDKIFLLTDTASSSLSMNLKCDPFFAEELRAKYKEVTPGYHMNKRHWNTVDFDGLLEDEFLRSMIDLSYQLVVDGLPRSTRDALKKWM